MEETKEELRFPCEYPLKVIGFASQEFIDTITALIKSHVGECHVTSKNSSGGKYVSLTATFIAESKECVDALYAEISQCEHVVMTM